MAAATVPKKMRMRRMFITFLSMMASGSERPTTDIMKERAVPRLTPFATKTSTTGTMPAALAYIGTARMTARGYGIPVFAAEIFFEESLGHVAVHRSSDGNTDDDV